MLLLPPHRCGKLLGTIKSANYFIINFKTSITAKLTIFCIYVLGEVKHIIINFTCLLLKMWLLEHF